MNIGIVILAAGASKRMGTPKQLLDLGGTTLLRRTVEVALATEFRPVVVVLGANKTQIAPQIIDLPVTIIENPKWEEGMSTSVKMGLVGLYMTEKKLDAAMVLVCDQPHISVQLLTSMAKVQALTSKKIVACQYEDQLGVPVLFEREMFTELLDLQGDKGARFLLHKFPEQTARVRFDLGNIDLDTPQDYQTYKLSC